MTTHQPLYLQSVDEALRALNSHKAGLETHEAHRRLREYGLNLIKPKKQSLLKRLLEPFASLFVSILVVAMIISLISHEKTDALVISGVLVINSLIYYVQQYSANRVLKSLRSHDITKLKVRRGDEIVDVSSDSIVPGDIVYLDEGMQVPADGRLLEAEALHVDEAVLTGESIPVVKNTTTLIKPVEIYDQTNMVLKGTVVHRGDGVMLVSATGNKTEMGKIGTLVSGADFGRSPIQRKIDSLTAKLAISIGVTVTFVFLLAVARGISFSEALRFSLALAVSVVPEGLPVALTVVLLISAKRLAGVRALVKKISSLETLGAITLIATDKTGTITKNRLSVSGIAHRPEDGDKFGLAVVAGLNGDRELRGDPLDQILEAHFKNYHIPKDWNKLEEYPFDQNLRVSGTLWRRGDENILYIKGAPEVLLDAKQGAENQHFRQELEAFVGKGYRTIAIASHKVQGTPKTLTAEILKEARVDGIIGLADEIRENINQSIAQAKAAGIKVVMLTGDHVATAREVAARIGLVTTAEQVADGALWMQRPRAK